jgi:hypothetical protein
LPACSPALVLPAGLDAEEAAETARAFQLLGCRHLVPTRLDAARRLGGVLAAADAGLAFTEAGIGAMRGRARPDRCGVAGPRGWRRGLAR